MTNKIDVIGDDIENPFNAEAMMDIADMFGSSCFFRRRKVEDLPGENDHQIINYPEDRHITCGSVADIYKPRIALDNLDNAADLYGFKLPPSSHSALIAGNEKRGISHEMKKIATDAVQIPMFGARLNTINVAAATGVALYYLFNGYGGKLQSRSHPESRRPEILFIGGTDHIELGSAIRSAGAFGWSRLFVEDRKNVWFGCDRVTRSEGRGAARRGRNAIKIVPINNKQKYAYKEVLVVTSKHGTALTRQDLTGGSSQLIVIPDETDVEVTSENWNSYGTNVRFVHIKAPSEKFNYHYRFFASVALAECSRQIGRRPPGKFTKTERQKPVYDNALEIMNTEKGEFIFLEDLGEF